MIKLNLIDFMKKYNSKNHTMNERELQRVYNHPICPRYYKIYSNKGFVKNDIGSVGGSPWTCFIVKDNKSFCFDSFGGAPDKFY